MSFETLLGKLNERPDLRGREFERICKWFLHTASEYRTQVQQVWLWDEWPGRWAADAGIDLVAETVEGGLWAIQAKAYDPAYSVTKADIDSFLSESARPEFSYRLLIATTDRIGHTARRTLAGQEKPAGVLLRSQLAVAEVAWPASPADLRPRRPSRKQPRPHQRKAVAAVVRGFRSNDRGQLVMACGTGKTLAACFLSQTLAARRVLVLVPSLSLLAQTLREWGLAAEFSYLAVCSDETVTGDQTDAVVASTSELGFPVTTDPTVIARFLRQRREGLRVVFATYQSSPRIAEAQASRTPGFDFVIADEAHRCAGPEAGIFATVLDAARIKGRKRLFMTATPRYFTGRIRKEAMEADWEIASMDDETRFGPVLHRLSFAEAIEQGLLSDYQVAVVGVSHTTYREYAERGVFVTADGEKVTDARTLASQLGLLRALANYDLHRVVSFHSRIRHASAFARSLPEVCAWLPADRRPDGFLWAESVSGKMTSGERDRRLNRLRAVGGPQRGVLSNARCLAEGVDVPTLDGVAFIEPRRSQIDIVQAVGRAIRKAEDKNVGTIVIPVFVDEDADTEKALESSEFDRVWQVVKALRAHDEALADELDGLRRALGRRGTSISRPGKLQLDLPVEVGDAFARAFDARLVERSTSRWEEGIGHAQAFREANGDLRVPATFVTDDGFALGRWIRKARLNRKEGRLASSRVAQLNALEMVWYPRDEDWDAGMRKAHAYHAANGDLRMLKTFITDDGFALGHWISKRRHQRKQGRLPPERVAELDALGMVWDLSDEEWQRGLAAADAYAAARGHLRVPSGFVTDDGFSLGTWVVTRRRERRKGVLARDRIAELDALGMVWDPFEEDWQRGLAAARAYRAAKGELRPTRDFVTDDGFPLGSWIGDRRQNRREGHLSPQRIVQLDELGMVWDTLDENWQRAVAALRAYQAATGHLRIPQRFKTADGLRLGAWINKCRSSYKQGGLSRERIAELDALGMVWDPFQEDWKRGLAAARAYKAVNGHLRVPQAFVTDEGFRLGGWISSRRAERRQQRLSPERVAELDALGMVWDGLDEKWKQATAAARAYREANGDLRVPATFVTDDGFALGRWIAKRRNDRRDERRRGRLTAERITELDALGMLWEPLDEDWQRGIASAFAYGVENGHLRVPAKFVTDDGFRLGSWLAARRSERRKGTLAAERISELDALGMVWDGREPWDGPKHVARSARASGETYQDIAAAAELSSQRGAPDRPGRRNKQ